MKIVLFFETLCNSVVLEIIDLWTWAFWLVCRPAYTCLRWEYCGISLIGWRTLAILCEFLLIMRASWSSVSKRTSLMYQRTSMILTDHCGVSLITKGTFWFCWLAKIQLSVQLKTNISQLCSLPSVHLTYPHLLDSCIHTSHSVCWWTFHTLHSVQKKRCHFIFDYNSRISQSIFFIIFVPRETGMNTSQSYVILTYLKAWWRHNCETSHVMKVFFIITLAMKNVPLYFRL